MTDDHLTTMKIFARRPSLALSRESSNMPVVASFSVPGEPVSKARARFTNKGSKVRSYTPEKTRRGEETMGWAFRSAARERRVNSTHQFGVAAVFYCGTRQRRDVDNMLKLILDGLNGVAWKDDSQVTEVSGRKEWTDGGPARTEVIVYRLDPVADPSQPCERCGKPVRVYQSRKARYCSAECRATALREKRATDCQQCGKTFYPREKGAKYCSRDCRYESGWTDAECASCGKFYRARKSTGRRTCSDDCRKALDARDHAERRSKHFPGRCRVCGSGTTRKEYTRCNRCRVAGLE